MNLWERRPMKPNRPKDASLLCRRCRHYFVTWEPKFPHGCRAMGFKSKKLPCVDVFATSGMPCQLFKEKPKKSGG